MAIDAGTGSVRAVIFDEEGTEIAASAHEWFHKTDPRYPGSMDFDWTAGWELTCLCIKEALAKAASKAGKDIATQIAAISTTCMREGLVLYDKAGEEIWACANVDARANDEVAQLKQISPGLESEIYHKSGQTFALGALPRLLWVKNKEGELYKRLSRVGMFNDWLIFRLSGGKNGGVLLVEPSNGSTTGIFNLQTRTWDKDIARQCGIRDDIFGETAECGSLAGKVSKEAAAQCGLCEGTPLVVGGGDCQLGTIGLGVTEENGAAIFGGSFWQYEVNSTKAETSADCAIRVNCHAVPGMWQFEALAFNPGLVMRWFRDAFCEGADYQVLDTYAAQIPAGSNGMVCTFSDVMNYINWRHATPAFMNFNLDVAAFNKYTFYRAIMENTALVTRGHRDLVSGIGGIGASANKAPSTITFAGGAAKSALWSQIVADTLNTRIAVPVVKEASALGTAIMAGFGVGLYKDIPSAAKKIAKIEKIFSPHAEDAAIYDKAYATWQEVYKPQLELADKGSTRHMWKAPGL